MTRTLRLPLTWRRRVTRASRSTTLNAESTPPAGARRWGRAEETRRTRDPGSRGIAWEIAEELVELDRQERGGASLVARGLGADPEVRVHVRGAAPLPGVEHDVAVARVELAGESVGLLHWAHLLDAPHLDAGLGARAGEAPRRTSRRTREVWWRDGRGGGGGQPPTIAKFPAPAVTCTARQASKTRARSRAELGRDAHLVRIERGLTHVEPRRRSNDARRSCARTVEPTRDAAFIHRCNECTSTAKNLPSRPGISMTGSSLLVYRDIFFVTVCA